MSAYRRARVPGATYFFTVNPHDRQFVIEWWMGDASSTLRVVRQIFTQTKMAFPELWFQGMILS
jgi:REP element-mobilizing transposase RayT